jgi:hypothetical protein
LRPRILPFVRRGRLWSGGDEGLKEEDHVGDVTDCHTRAVYALFQSFHIRVKCNHMRPAGGGGGGLVAGGGGGLVGKDLVWRGISDHHGAIENPVGRI